MCSNRILYPPPSFLHLPYLMPTSKTVLYLQYTIHQHLIKYACSRLHNPHTGSFVQSKREARESNPTVSLKEKRNERNSQLPYFRAPPCVRIWGNSTSTCGTLQLLWPRDAFPTPSGAARTVRPWMDCAACGRKVTSC